MQEDKWSMLVGFPGVRFVLDASYIDKALTQQRAALLPRVIPCVSTT